MKRKFLQGVLQASFCVFFACLSVGAQPSVPLLEDVEKYEIRGENLIIMLSYFDEETDPDGSRFERFAQGLTYEAALSLKEVDRRVHGRVVRARLAGGPPN